jgi:4,5-dihydroxyphthalate decarboxylase
LIAPAKSSVAIELQRGWARGETSMTYPASGPVRLAVNLSDYPLAKALKSGHVRSDLVEFDFCGPTPANKGFKPMVRDGVFDAGELAIVTHLQAVQYGKPLVLLPATVLGHVQHPFLVYNSERRPTFGPKDLEGARVAVRAYSQTTAVWIRGILQHEYGVDLDKLVWVCWDDAHPAEYTDPPNVERAPPGAKTLDQMFLDGDVDAAIPAADLLAHPAAKPVIPDPVAAGRRWTEKYGGATPINHMFVVRKELSERRPDVVREVYRMLSESKAAAAPPKDGVDRTKFGLAANRRALELAIQYSVEQKLIDRRIGVDALFDATTRALG